MFVREYPGEEQRPCLVFVHGLGESGLCFESIVGHPDLRGWTRWVVDLPGYGRSAWTAQEALPTLSDLADHLMAWVHAKRSGMPTVLVGHSMGGVIALLAAERHADKLAAIVDVDGNKSLGDCSFSAKAARDSLEEFEAKGLDALRDEVYEAGLQDRAQRGYYASLRLCNPKAFHRHSVELVQLSKGESMARRLASLPMPKLYVAGQPDGACGRSISLLEAAKVPWVAVAPSGHWPFIDQPDAFAGVLARFVAEVPSG
jgi:pimeloyl-ACP methyl ester carboxylesterase